MAGGIQGLVACVLACVFCRIDPCCDGSESSVDVEIDSNGIHFRFNELDISDRNGLLRVDVGHLASIHCAGMGVFDQLVLVWRTSGAPGLGFVGFCVGWRFDYFAS